MSAPKSMARPVDWNEYGREADNTEVVVTKAADTRHAHAITHLHVSFDSTATAEVDLFGCGRGSVPGKIEFDGTDTDVLDLTADTFTIANHGLSNADKVVFHSGGGTAPTGLTSGNSYFVVGVSGSDFQLESSVGGGAIDMSGTQANFGTELMILVLSKQWTVYDHLELDFSAPLIAPIDTEIIIKVAAVASVQGIVDVGGYTY